MTQDEKFALGLVVATPQAEAILRKRGSLSDEAGKLLARHHSGDWGSVSEEDQASNEAALKHDHRIVSLYGEDDERLYVITEADRSSTTILTPEEY